MPISPETSLGARRELPYPHAAANPICVDLDGTLIRSDLLIETTFTLLKQNPLLVFLLPVWLARGKAHLKQQIADRVDIDVSLLPYNEALLEQLRREKASGRQTVLATASNVRYAEQVAIHLGIFDDVLASDSDTNLSGTRKRDRLIEAFGERGFAYAGNAAADLPIWQKAGEAVLVDVGPRVAEQVIATTPVARIFNSPRPDARAYLTAVRFHQWLKNLLVFLPLLLAHEWSNLALLLQAAIAFLAFGLCASSVYVLNDLLDLEADRQHPTKRRRPFAAGTIPMQQGLALFPLLLSASIILAAVLPPWFLAIIGLYFGLTLAYSLFLKRMALVDVLVLAGLYTLRVIAGGAATGLGPSFWLLAFSMFLFLSLALVKRYSELFSLEAGNKTFAPGRGYQVVDLETLAQFGVASGYAAALVLALYIDSTAVGSLYRVPQALWLACPPLLYWISRVWLLARRGEVLEDPLLFAVSDRQSRWLVVVLAGIVWAAV